MQLSRPVPQSLVVEQRQLAQFALSLALLRFAQLLVGQQPVGQPVVGQRLAAVALVAFVAIAVDSATTRLAELPRSPTHHQVNWPWDAFDSMLIY